MPKRLTIEQFIEKAKAVHGDRYSYSNSVYVNAHTHIAITCAVHGDFHTNPNNHLTGYNCPTCGTEQGSSKCRKTLEQFVMDAKAVHGERYDYSLVKYKNDNEKVELLCPVHGSFWIRPTNHLHASQGCRSCNMPKSSKCVKWLDSLNVPEQYRETRLTINGTIIIADAFDPETNTVYEYWGDYWHGNPTKYDQSAINPHVNKTFGELYQRTQDKRVLISSMYDLVEAWETSPGP